MSHILLPAAPALACCIDNFLIGEIPASVARLPLHFPAAIRPRLVLLLLRGGGTFNEPGCVPAPLPDAFIAAPKTSPRQYVIDGGSAFIVAVLRPGAFLHLFDTPLHSFSQCVIPLPSLVGEAQYALLRAALAASGGGESALAAVQRFLAEVRLTGNRGQPFFLPRLTSAHLAMATGDLAAMTGLSERQFERHFLANYGMPLRDYRRLVRYMNALNMVLACTWEHGVVTRIAQDCGYSDQAHFIRDFRAFVGHAPGEFIRKGMADLPQHALWKDGSYNIHD